MALPVLFHDIIDLFFFCCSIVGFLVFIELYWIVIELVDADVVVDAIVFVEFEVVLVGEIVVVISCIGDCGFGVEPL